MFLIYSDLCIVFSIQLPIVFNFAIQKFSERAVFFYNFLHNTRLYSYAVCFFNLLFQLLTPLKRGCPILGPLPTPLINKKKNTLILNPNMRCIKKVYLLECTPVVVEAGTPVVAAVEAVEACQYVTR